MIVDLTFHDKKKVKRVGFVGLERTPSGPVYLFEEINGNELKVDGWEFVFGRVIAEEVKGR